MSGTRTRAITRLCETYLAILQGKGSGAGWDLAGEARAAAAFLENVPNPMIFDVGASTGEWATSLASLLGPGVGRYFLFEPQAACQGRLAALPNDTFTVVPVALGDAIGEVTLRYERAGSQLASLYERSDSFLTAEPNLTETVDMLTVDSFMESKGIEQVDLMKVDVEGAEMNVFHGARKAFAASQISTVCFEFGSANVYSRTFFHDVWELLRGAGFRIWRICPGGRVVSIDEYAEDLEHFRGVSNYVASRRPPR